MKNEYSFERGKHFSHGKKEQPFYVPSGLLLLGIILNFIGGVSIWYSVTCYAAAAIIYYVAQRKLNTTFMKTVFEDSCLYKLDGPDQGDINKLFGIGFGDHMKYSGRIGWVCSSNQIDLYAYVHNGSEISERKKLLSCEPNEPVELCLKFNSKEYEFSASKRNGERARAKIARTTPFINSLMAYRLYPYFGGDKTAPHNMKLTLVEMK